MLTKRIGQEDRRRFAVDLPNSVTCGNRNETLKYPGRFHRDTERYFRKNRNNSRKESFSPNLIDNQSSLQETKFHMWCISVPYTSTVVGTQHAFLRKGCRFESLCLYVLSRSLRMPFACFAFCVVKTSYLQNSQKDTIYSNFACVRRDSN